MTYSRSTSKRQTAQVQTSASWVFIAYAIVGLANIILPAIVFTCSYLIIPFPRGAVILIEILPCLAAKLLFPHLIHHVGYFDRLLIILISWVVCGVVTWATPPNIEPPVRVLIVMLASATAATTDVWMLGMLRHHGRPGVTGWGVGTGLGYVAAAMYPYVVAVNMGIFLRATIDCLSYFLPPLVWGFYMLLRTPRTHKSVKPQADEVDSDSEEGVSLLIQEPPRAVLNFKERISQNIDRMTSIGKQYMQPLYQALLSQAIYVPGLFRATPELYMFDTFFASFTALSVAFHIGNLIGRSSLLFKRTEKRRLLLRILQILNVLFILNAMFVFFTSSLLILGFTFVAGVFVGTTYIQTVDGALEATLRDSPDHCEFLMGSIGVADAAGLLIGSLASALLELLLCENSFGWGNRWCYTPN